MKNKKIYLFTVFFPFGEKGESFVNNEIEYLAKSFDEVIIVPTYIKGEMKHLNFKNVKVDIKFAENFTNFKAIFYSLISKEFYMELVKKPSIILSLYKLQRAISFFGRGRAIFNYLKNKNDTKSLYYSYWFNGVTYGMYLFKRLHKNIKYVFRVHRGDLYLETNKGYLPFRIPILKDVNKVYSISEDGKKYILNYFTNDVNIVVSRLGIKNFCFQNNKKKGKKFHIVSCSYVREVKKVDLIYKVLNLAALQLKDVSIKWTHIGDGPLFNELKKKVKVTDNFEVDLKGYMSTPEIYKFYNENYVDLFINLSDSEGIPVSIMEAMCCGIPVIAKDVGGNSEIINSNNGFILKKNVSENEIVELIKSIVLNPEKLELKRTAAKNTWNSLYNADKNYQQFVDDLLKVLND